MILCTNDSQLWYQIHWTLFFMWHCLAFLSVHFYLTLKWRTSLSLSVHQSAPSYHVLLKRPPLPRLSTKPFLSAAKPSLFRSPPTPADTIIPGWEALVVPPQLFRAINASLPICAVRGGEEREKEDVSREWDKIPLYVCQGGRKSCNYNMGGFGLQLLSSVC